MIKSCYLENITCPVDVNKSLYSKIVNILILKIIHQCTMNIICQSKKVQMKIVLSDNTKKCTPADEEKIMCLTVCCALGPHTALTQKVQFIKCTTYGIPTTVGSTLMSL